MVLCFSENTSLEYDVSHQGLYEHVCGVKPLWNKYLAEQEVPLNSILAGYTVYLYYLDKTNSDTKALKRFKKIKSNNTIWIVHKVQRVISEVKEIYLKDK